MPHFALELDDRAVAIAADGDVSSSAPSAVFDGTAGTTVGANAWRELRVRPQGDLHPTSRSFADATRERLRVRKHCSKRS